MTAIISTNTNVATMDKFQRASPINSMEEKKCDACNKVIFEKELYMICQVKEYKGKIVLKNFCCDCFKEKVEQDMERIQKWSNRTVKELADMLAPIMDYMGSDTKQKIDENRKMLNRIEGED